MANKEFILNLGKLMISVAWVDGKLQNEELNALKELLFLLPDISGEDWMQLEMYMASPIGEEERHQLLERVLVGVRSSADKNLVIDTLQKLVAADGVIDHEESAALTAIRQDLEEQSTGLLAHLSGSIRKALKNRGSHYRGQSAREDHLEDFIKNTIYFQLVLEMKSRNLTWQLPESQIRKICLAAGLMAYIAWVDNEVCSREQESMARGLRECWGLSEEEARVVTEISRTRIMKGLDLVRLTTGFCEYTTLDERKAFLRCLFSIANAANKTSYGEIEEIRNISKALGLPHQEFIDAKLTIPREDRGGL